MTIIDLRCSSALHGRFMVEERLIEVKCWRKRCGAKPGVVVLHRIDIHTSEVVETLRFASAAPKSGEETHGTDHHTVAVRSA